MAVVRQRNRVAGVQDSVLDAGGLSHVLAWPAGLSAKERLSLFRRGKKDARKGLVYINEYGELTSPFCETLVQNANRRIELEWTRCNERSFDAQTRIDQAKLMIDEINEKLKEETILRDEALDEIRGHHFVGDDAVSEHLSQRRQQNREKPIINRFEREKSRLNDELLAAESGIIPFRYVLKKAEESARSREQLVRADYLWRLSVYAYGASNYVKVTPNMINDSALSGEPRRNHERIFGSLRGRAEDEDGQ